MALFTDNKDREWEVNIDAPMIMKIRADCDPNFLLNDDEKENTYYRLQQDPVLLCRVIFLLCVKERESRSVSMEDFYLNVIGNVIDSAAEAMLQAILAFIPRRTRTVLEVFAAQDKLRQKAIEKAAAKINSPEKQEEVMTQIQFQIDAAAERIMTQLTNATNSLDLSVSTPES